MIWGHSRSWSHSRVANTSWVGTVESKGRMRRDSLASPVSTLQPSTSTHLTKPTGQPQPREPSAVWNRKCKVAGRVGVGMMVRMQVEKGTLLTQTTALEGGCPHPILEMRHGCLERPDGWLGKVKQPSGLDPAACVCLHCLSKTSPLRTSWFMKNSVTAGARWKRVLEILRLDHGVRERRPREWQPPHCLLLWPSSHCSTLERKVLLSDSQDSCSEDKGQFLYSLCSWRLASLFYKEHALLHWPSLGSNKLVVGHKWRTQQEFKLRQKDEGRRLDLLP